MRRPAIAVVLLFLALLPGPAWAWTSLRGHAVADTPARPRQCAVQQARRLTRAAADVVPAVAASLGLAGDVVVASP
jgi:hypothetical protein